MGGGRSSDLASLQSTARGPGPAPDSSAQACQLPAAGADIVALTAPASTSKAAPPAPEELPRVPSEIRSARQPLTPGIQSAGPADAALSPADSSRVSQQQSLEIAVLGVPPAPASGVSNAPSGMQVPAPAVVSGKESGGAGGSRGDDSAPKEAAAPPMATPAPAVRDQKALAAGRVPALAVAAAAATPRTPAYIPSPAHSWVSSFFDLITAMVFPGIMLS